jgi:NADP-dependent 3-hydroxy acid dehydrogenase YdfG
MKRIVIVGATSGIGLEVARLCIRAGWRVGAAGRRKEALEALRSEAPGQVETETIDITRDDAPERLARLVERLGGMEIYFHASGIGSRNTALRPDIELNTLRTNGEGFVRMVTAAFGHFRSHGGGRIAVISSIAGTKAAVTILTNPSPLVRRVFSSMSGRSAVLRLPMPEAWK